MPSGPIRLHIADVLTAVPAETGIEAGMVVLTEDSAPYRSLRIIIGPTEANAIKAGWDGSVPSRPSTWDLFVSTVALLGGRLDRVVITAVHEERHYFAHLELEHAGERRILACRPSDAIALAVRGYNVDILAEPSVLEAAGVLADGTKPGRVPEPEAPDTAARLAERETALAAREAELATREQALLERQRLGEPDAVVEPVEQTEPVEPADQTAAAEEGDAGDVEALASAGVDPATGDPATVDSATVDPATGDPATADHATGDPATVDRAAVDRAAVDPATADPATADHATVEAPAPAGLDPDLEPAPATPTTDVTREEGT